MFGHDSEVSIILLTFIAYTMTVFRCYNTPIKSMACYEFFRCIMEISQYPEVLSTDRHLLSDYKSANFNRDQIVFIENRQASCLRNHCS
jgi:hypothetical protein